MWKEPLYQYAKEHGGQYIGSLIDWSDEGLVVLPGEPNLYIQMKMPESRGISSWPFFQVAAVIECRNPITLKLRPQNLLRKGLGILKRPVKTGDPGVDDIYFISSPQPGVAQNVLRDPEVRQLLAAEVQPCLVDIVPVAQGENTCLIQVESQRAPFTSDGTELMRMDDSYDATYMDHMVALCRAMWNAAHRYL